MNMKYNTVFLKIDVVGGAKYQQKYTEICYKCAKKLGIETPNEGD